MRYLIAAIVIACAAPSGASIVINGAGLAGSVARVAASLPDPATAALMFGGLGLVAGSRRAASLRAPATPPIDADRRAASGDPRR